MGLKYSDGDGTTSRKNECEQYIKTLPPVKSSVNTHQLQCQLGLTLYNKLYGYQKSALEFLINRHGRCILSLDMGLGKTFISICLMLSMIRKTRKRATPSHAKGKSVHKQHLTGPPGVLVLAPAKVVVQFAHAIDKWTREQYEYTPNHCNGDTPILIGYGDQTVTSMRDRTRRSRKRKNPVTVNPDTSDPQKDPVDHDSRLRPLPPEVYTVHQRIYTDGDSNDRGPCYWRVMSYAKARLCMGALMRENLTGLICDESQTLKNVDSALVRSLLPLSRMTSYVLLLSGLPLNVSRDIYSQLLLVYPKPGPLSRKYTFMHRYCAPRKRFISRDTYKWEFNGKSNTTELRLFLKEHVLFRFTKEMLADSQQQSETYRSEVFDPNLNLSTPSTTKECGNGSSGNTRINQSGVDPSPTQKSCDIQSSQSNSNELGYSGAETESSMTTCGSIPRDETRSSGRYNGTQLVHCTRTVLWLHCSKLERNRSTIKRQCEKEAYDILKEKLRNRNREWLKHRDWKNVREAEDTDCDTEMRKKQELFLSYIVQAAKDKIKRCRAWLIRYLQERCQMLGEKVLLFATHHCIMNELESITMDALSPPPPPTEESVVGGVIHESSVNGCFFPNYDPVSNFACQWHLNQTGPTTPQSNSSGITIPADPVLECTKLNPPPSVKFKNRNPVVIPYIRIDGKSSGRMVHDKIERFRVDDACQVAILSIRACSAGIELQAANNVLFLQMSFNADDNLQAEARAHRLGQTRVVDVTYLLMRESVEEEVWKIVNRKLENIQSVVHCSRPVFHTRDIRVGDGDI